MVIAVLMAIALPCTAAGQAGTEGAAKVLRAQGNARWRAAGEDWRPIRAGTTLKPGATLETGKEPGTLVELALCEPETPVPAFSPSSPTEVSHPVTEAYQPATEHDMVRLWEGSSLTLEKFTYLNPGLNAVSEIQLDLHAGRLTGKVKTLAAGSIYEVKLPGGIAGVKGTLYDFRAEGVLRVLEGAVVVAYFDAVTGNAVTQLINAGQEFDLRSALLSYLTSADRTALEEVARSLKSWQSQRRGKYLPDRTIERVSPTTGSGR